jgi:hypothetical protein
MLLSIGRYAITEQPRVIVAETSEEHHGKGDNGKGIKRVIFKPTGLLDRKATKTIHLPEKNVNLVPKSNVVAKPVEKEVVSMSLAEIDFEIMTLMHKQYRSREDEAMLLILIAATL